METTYGLPRYRLPPTDFVVQQIVAFCREALEEGATPVLLGYSLGKAQEILCSLAEANLQPMLHGSVYRMTRIYEQFGQAFCRLRALRPEGGHGQGAHLSAEREPFAHDPATNEQARRDDQRLGSRAECRLPLPGRCRFSAFRSRRLRRPAALRRAGATKARPDAARLRGGIRARPARPRHRSVGVERAEPTGTHLAQCARAKSSFPAPSRSPAVRARRSEFQAFAQLGEEIAATPAKLEKIRLLSEYLRALDPEQLRIAAIFLTGKPFAQTDQRTLQTGWAIIYRALLGASGRGNAELRRIASSHGDAGKAAFEALEGRTTPEPFSLGEAQTLFENLHKTRGPVAKTELLAGAAEKTFAARGAVRGEDFDRRPAHRLARRPGRRSDRARVRCAAR